jgi:hypothetical protein
MCVSRGAIAADHKAQEGTRRHKMTDSRAPAVMLTIAEADVRTLAAKLKGLHALLTPPEQALLHLVLQRAAAGAAAPDAPPDGRGHTWAVSFNPFVYLDAIVGDPLAVEAPPARRGGRRAARG